MSITTRLSLYSKLHFYSQKRYEAKFLLVNFETRKANELGLDRSSGG